MRFTSTLSSLALVGGALAFPAEVFEKVQRDPELAAETAHIYEGLSRRQLEGLETFDAKAQKISVTGKHKWVAPGPTDLRGPCPGLNAFANHGYLPHNGYATISQFLDATQNVVGMGIGLASFLAVYGAVIDGDLTAWSIGGPPPKSLVPTSGLLGVGQGIGGSHNKYESDASPMRPDLYQYGNDYKLRVQQWQQLSDLQPSGKNFDIDVLTKFRALRFDTQVKQNPYFFNGPFTGVLVQPAAYTFMYRFMANHSAANPVGTLNRDVLMSWFSLSGTSGNYKWTPGYERIPNNWYRRDLKVPYDQVYFVSDVADAAAKYPQFLNIGGNTGKPDTFTGVNVKNLTGGAYNGRNIGKGNKFACLGFQFAANAQPDVLQNLGDNPAAQAALQQALSGVLSGVASCPQLEKIDYSQFDQYPGSRAPSAFNPSA